MDIKRFKESLVPLMTTPSGDGAFTTLRILTHGMAGTRTAKLINFASRCMDEGEFYLEIGTFSGYTLISAAYQSNSFCIGVDDFSLEEVIKEESRASAKEMVRGALNRNLAEYGQPSCKFIQANFRNISLTPESMGKLAVVFIDGNHNYQEVKEAIEKFSPFFAKDVVLIFDDIQYGNIPTYLRELWAQDGYEMLLYMVSTPSDGDERIHKHMPLNEYVANGICVMTRRTHA